MHSNYKSTTIKTVIFAVAALVSATIVLVAIFGAIKPSADASAARASDFKPGRIIDDAVFYNANAMNASQIQAFLNSKVPFCDTNGSQPATDWGRPDISRATLASYIRNGTHGYNKNTDFHAPPYTCLKNFRQNTPQVEAASGLGCSAMPARNNQTAAQIINDVSKACGINPQVLLILLNKEQSLVTDIWPLNLQYERATGFACPDNAGGACNPSYNGFFRQVYSAARQFKTYQAYPNSYNYVAGRTNNILWQVAPPKVASFLNSNGSPANMRSGHCGHSRVLIENQATAALYIYTPYRPNPAAMSSYPGTGDACSAYGNRNFWFMFTNWFGSTNHINYGYDGYRLKGPGMSSTTMEVGSTKTVSVRFRNTGEQPWYDKSSAVANNARPVILHALHPNQKGPSGFNGAFATPTRATEVFSNVYDKNGAKKSDSSVAQPGETVEFSFDIATPADLRPDGNYAIAYQPVIPASSGQPRINVATEYSLYHVTLTPPPPPASGESIVDTSSINMTNQDYSGFRLRGPGMSSATMAAGSTKTVSVLIKNTGTETWYDIGSASGNNSRPMILHALHPNRSKVSGFNGEFTTPTRATERIVQVYRPDGSPKGTTESTVSVLPGEVARYEFTVKAPEDLSPDNSYAIYYNPVIPAASSPRIEAMGGDLYYIIIK